MASLPGRIRAMALALDATEIRIIGSFGFKKDIINKF